MKKRYIIILIIIALLFVYLKFSSSQVMTGTSPEDFIGVVISNPSLDGNITQTIIGGNLTNFTSLTDTPSSYSGAGGDCVKVNSGETALEFGGCSNATGGSFNNTNVAYLNNSQSFTGVNNFTNENTWFGNTALTQVVLNFRDGDGIGQFVWTGSQSLFGVTSKFFATNFLSSGNYTAGLTGLEYFIGSGAKLHDVNYTETDPIFTSANSSLARTGDCPAGEVVQNTTTGGVECVSVSSSGNPFDQSLNTTDDVQFNNVTVNDSLILNNFTSGSVLFIGPNGEVSESNDNFFWDSSTNRLGIGLNNPQYSFDVSGKTRISAPSNSIDLTGLILNVTTGNFTWDGVQVATLADISNETALVLSINTTGNIQALGFYNKSEIDNNLSLYIPLSDLPLENRTIVNCANITGVDACNIQSGGDFFFANFTDSFNSNLSAQTTDNLTQGLTNLYDNQSWNQNFAANLFVNLTGDTMTGNLFFTTGNGTSYGNTISSPRGKIYSDTSNLIIDGSSGDIVLGNSFKDSIGIGTDPNPEYHIYSNDHITTGVQPTVYMKVIFDYDLFFGIGNKPITVLDFTAINHFTPLGAIAIYARAVSGKNNGDATVLKADPYLDNATTFTSGKIALNGIDFSPSNSTPIFANNTGTNITFNALRVGIKPSGYENATNGAYYNIINATEGKLEIGSDYKDCSLITDDDGTVLCGTQFFGYDTIGDVNVTNPGNVSYSNVPIIDSIYSIDSSNTSITFNKGGRYKITFDVGVYITSGTGNRVTSVGYLVYNGASLENSGAECSMYNRNETNGWDSCSITYMLNGVSEGDSIYGQVRELVTGDQAFTAPNELRMSIEKI